MFDTDIVKRKWVTPEDILDVRAGKYNSFPWESRRCSWCVQCRGRLTGTRLGVIITGVQGIRFFHSDPRECAAVITQRKATAKPIIVRTPKPYVVKVAGWVLSSEEIKAATFITDNRLPRRVVQCRICGQDIIAGEGRMQMKVKDERGWNSREGFVHALCVPVWTDSSPLATDRFQQWQQQHGQY